MDVEKGLSHSQHGKISFSTFSRLFHRYASLAGRAVVWPACVLLLFCIINIWHFLERPDVNLRSNLHFIALSLLAQPQRLGLCCGDSSVLFSPPFQKSWVRSGYTVRLEIQHRVKGTWKNPQIPGSSPLSANLFSHFSPLKSENFLNLNS